MSLKPARHDWRLEIWPLFGRHFLTGRAPRGERDLNVWIDGQPAALATAGSRKLLRSLAFAAVAPAAPNEYPGRRTRHVTVRLDGKVCVDDDVSLVAASVAALAGSPFLSALHDCLLLAVQPDLGEIVASRIACRPAEALGPHVIEASARSGTAMVAAGWVENIGHRRIHMVGEDLQDFVPHDAIVIRSKPDIRPSGPSRFGPTDRHGFLFVLPETIGNGGYFIVESDPRSDTSIFHGPFAKPAGEDEALAARTASAPFGTVFATPPLAAERLYRPLITRRRPPLSPKRIDYTPPGGELGPPEYSIVIPFYGDAFFLTCIHHLQRILDEQFELIVVVDDPRLWRRIESDFETRKSFVRLRTTLVRLNANYGYGIANNAGAAAAAGRVLFFMNSDVLVRSADPLIRAGKEIRQGSERLREIVAGFPLRFEDETVQHVGVAFERSPSLHNLYLAEHPMKGLPMALYDERNSPAFQAVTGALLGISAALYRRLGGFDPAFERADFEDADLCLRAFETGAEIKVMAATGLYHLESQSVSCLGAEAREMLTYLNCMEFNRRWGDWLDRRPRVRKRRRSSPPVPLEALAPVP